MEHLVVYTPEMRDYYVRKRPGESKIGEHFLLPDPSRSLRDAIFSSPAKFVLLGLPEDLGVRANFGRGGAHTEWHPALTFLANVQSNRFMSGDEVLLLGHINFSDLLEEAKHLDLHLEGNMIRLREMVTEIDQRVFPVIQIIVESGKIPIVIGGGHNNAYGMIRGTALGCKQPVNVLNIDAHSDLRECEGRHSGNGFRYALEESFLHKYFIFGLHENYTPEHIFRFLDKNHQLDFVLFEDLAIRESLDFKESLTAALEFVGDDYFGIELDMDAIQNMPSSARTSSGFLANDVRRIIHQAGMHQNARYLHICEGAPTLTHKKADIKTGKLVAYFITDFIKARKTIS